MSSTVKCRQAWAFWSRTTYQGATKTALRGEARMEVNERDTAVCCRTEAPVAGAAGASRQIDCHPADTRPPKDSPCSAPHRVQRLREGSRHRGASRMALGQGKEPGLRTGGCGGTTRAAP